MEEKLVTLNKEKEKIISDYAQSTLSISMQFDNVGEFFSSSAYSDAKSTFSTVISDTVTGKYQDSFHKRLSGAEKANYISQDKRIRYEKNCERIHKGTEFGVRVFMDGLPLLYQCIENNVNRNNAEKFVLSWMGYINQGNEVTPIMKSNTKVIFEAMDLKYNTDMVTNILLNASSITAERLPRLNKHNRFAFNSAENETLLTLAQMIIAPSDLQKAQTKERALEFISELFGINYLDATAKIGDIIAAQNHLTELLTFSAIDYTTFFSHFISSVQEANRFGSYDINMDAYAQLRQRNQEKVHKISKEVEKIGVQAVKAFIKKDVRDFLGCMKPARDIVRISEEMMSDTLTPPRARAWEFMDAAIAHREAFNLPMEGE